MVLNFKLMKVVLALVSGSYEIVKFQTKKNKNGKQILLDNSMNDF